MTTSKSTRRLPPHAGSLFVFAYAVWTLLTWTLTIEVVVAGLIAAVVVAAIVQPLVADAGRIRVSPRRVLGCLELAGFALCRVVAANFELSRRIWAPSMPVRTGMVTVPTKVRSDSGLCSVGVITSLIVDNQIVDVDRGRNRLLYHAIVVPDMDEAYDAINGPVDRRVAALEGRRDG